MVRIRGFNSKPSLNKYGKSLNNILHVNAIKKLSEASVIAGLGPAETACAGCHVMHKGARYIIINYKTPPDHGYVKRSENNERG